MRAASPLLALLLLLCACRPSGQTWIVAGQSNAVGRSRLDVPAPIPTPSGFTTLALTSSGESKLAVDPLTSPNDDRRSPWPHFLVARHEGGHAKPYLVQTAFSSTCLAWFRAPGEPRWAPETGDLYERMLTRMAEARALHFPRAAAVLWHQGECEAFMPYTVDQIREIYRDALMNLADAIGADLGVPLVAALIVPAGARKVAVNDAIQEAAALHPSIFVGPVTGDLALEEPDEPLHVRDIVTLGRRWADAVEAAGL
jgi:hypothetical protein